ncbi:MULTISPECIES: LysR substrate-binding domain-containing protein [Halobacteriovorax]|uniref:LysR family transcriptional regulator n=1 Tax=Halobacteriovorax vibrionivorans TaxID=2152716 RepID=A0ABY0IHU4_9BACT|nr:MULTISPECIES: LysR substrate-binding domain-containing protein [Halobacteriovorax]RZF22055.1 LysR family transcriptional regulator [Halobacteriovorax vibrionivorans]TGD47081.1 LysR family transcriptional regulator [Halobacteriovorax sp. Y22]
METIKDLTHIYSFIKVAQFRSFTKAAEALKVSRSHLSKSVKELEEKLGQPLLKRNTRFIDFTDFGKKYFETCANHIEEIERFTKISKETVKDTKGKIRISLAGAYGEDVIAPMISNILLKHPGIEAELDFSTELVDITTHEFDLAIRVAEKKPTKGFAIQISERKEFVCASPNYLNKFGIPKKPKELINHNCLIGSNEKWSFTHDSGNEKVSIKGNFKSSNGRAIMNASLQGLGICKLPGVYVLDHIRNKTLLPLLSDYTQQSIPIWAVTPSKKSISSSVKLLLQEFGVFLF